MNPAQSTPSPHTKQSAGTGAGPTGMPLLELFDDVPADVIAAAKIVHIWAIANGHERWQLLDICSRNHAHDHAALVRANGEMREAVQALLSEANETLTEEYPHEMRRLHAALAHVAGEGSE